MASAFFGAVIGHGIQSQDFETEYWKFVGLFSAALDCIRDLVLIPGLMSSGFDVCYCLVFE